MACPQWATQRKETHEDPANDDRPDPRGAGGGPSERVPLSLHRIASRLRAPTPRRPPRDASDRRPVDPKADANHLRGASEKLAAAKQLTFEAYNTVDQMLDSGQKVQMGPQHQGAGPPSRPAPTPPWDGDQENMEFVYDGAQGLAPEPQHPLLRPGRCARNHRRDVRHAGREVRDDAAAERPAVPGPLPGDDRPGGATGQHLGVANVSASGVTTWPSARMWWTGNLDSRMAVPAMPCKLVIILQGNGRSPQFTSVSIELETSRQT